MGHRDCLNLVAPDYAKALTDSKPVGQLTRSGSVASRDRLEWRLHPDIAQHMADLLFAQNVSKTMHRGKEGAVSDGDQQLKITLGPRTQ
jgi:hypothetical protein